MEILNVYHGDHVNFPAGKRFSGQECYYLELEWIMEVKGLNDSLDGFNDS